AGLDFSRHRVAVSRRTALEDVADVYLGAGEAGGGEQLLQELARVADERAALPVLVGSRRFTDAHHFGREWAFARDGEGAGAGKRAEVACANAFVEFVGDGGNRAPHLGCLPSWLS